jgi:hypothetical protein
MNRLKRTWPYILLLLLAAIAFGFCVYYLIGGKGFIVVIPFVVPIFIIWPGSKKKPDDRPTQEP